ncbi:MAG: hypothetical protein A2937_00575 [Candidatus Yonathbacteria bacterium RIFCSPLOWO2_01_FULL_47_33b]|uniref:Uncharacterized protein n=1 Tax=Candidatus Yonathbacteria bacterium RIFCSPLOWO2_01_FULL_47_33b TaxID=1802727 RepID=A0A1G2SFY7_9BACT|nr:MAG: hypothetical protein A2937_00575 [Candidatus Yonathbacteria bacterium RIFCSPLOWO2_01_FULL_47_33b]
MNRKTLTIIALAIFLILMGIGAYFFYFKKAPTTQAPTGAFPGEGLPVSGTPGVGTGEGEGEAFVPGGAAPLPRLYELHKLPVAGAGFAEVKDKKGAVTSIAARYIERGLGHIYETPLNTYTESRIVNETRSRLSEALWGNNGKSVAIRYFDDTESAIKTQILNIGAFTTPAKQATSTEATSEFLNVEEVFLPDYIPFMALAGDGSDKLFYLENGNASSAGFIATLKNTSVAEIFASTFTEWLPQFPNQKLVTLTTKPSAKVLGHLFFLDTKTKSLTKVLSGINGLTTLTSRDGSAVLYAEIRNGLPELAIYDVVKKETRQIALQTLPEKCAWSAKSVIVYCAVPQTLPQAEYPDQWYQGLFSFSDNIWKIDTKTGVVEKILTPSDLRASSLDMINLTLSSDDSYLLFMNKITGTPWVFRIATDAPVVASTAPEVTLTEPTPSVTEGMQKIR